MSWPYPNVGWPVEDERDSPEDDEDDSPEPSPL